jgi:FRG domain
MRYPDRQITTVAETLDRLKQDSQSLSSEFSAEIAEASQGTSVPVQVPVWFRGLTSSKRSLITTMSREGNLDEEQDMMNRFKQNAVQFLNHIPTDWEWMFLMRHHGLPSRLLDWTESALIGLYFSVTPALYAGAVSADLSRNDDKDGALWCLLPTELNKVSSLYSRGQFEIPMFEDEDSNSQLYLPRSVAATGGKGHSGINPGAAIGMRGTTRMQAQQGVFVITHRNQTPIEDIGDTRHIWKYVVPADAKKELRAELRLIGMTPLAVFPELDSVALGARRSLNV